ncbi:MAG: hypothetical protein ACYC7J_18455 [Syntrophales bacterium]
MGKQQKYFPTDEEKKVLYDHYDGTTLKINKIVRLLDKKYPRWYIRNLAKKLGLARVKEPDWSPAEEVYVEENYPRMGLKALQGGLRRMGYRRSTTGINLKIKRLGMTRDMDDGFTMHGLCDLLFAGQDMCKAIRRWIELGWLKAKRRGTLRKESQGGDMWYVSPDWVRAFILAHPDEIDLRLVEQLALIRLIAGTGNIVTPCKCPTCGAEWDEEMFNPGVSLVRKYCPNCRLRHADVEVYYNRVAL